MVVNVAYGSAGADELTFCIVDFERQLSGIIFRHEKNSHYRPEAVRDDRQLYGDEYSRIKFENLP
jgi:hypothetical protein